MTAETSNARGEWVLVPREPTEAMISHGEEWEYSTISNGPAMARQLYAAMLAAAPPPAAEGVQAGDGCHCATCTCEPNMTPAVRFDLSPAQKEGAIREHLIRLGWTPTAADAEAKTVPVPTRVHLIGETAVIVGTPGRGWDEDAQDAHNCDAMGCATIGPHVLARVPFTDERALPTRQGGGEINMDVTVRDGAWVGTYAEWCRRKQPAAVDEAAVKRAVAAVMSAPAGISVEAYVRIVLEAALTGEQ